jgi:SAM-dependent methyltransferase/uncharacterized protein YbaR (Trm112 family)
MEFATMEMLSFLACPKCRGDLAGNGDSFICRKCGERYPLSEGVPQFDLPNTTEVNSDIGGKDDRRRFWDSGWESRYHGDHAHLARLSTQSEWESFLKQRQAVLEADRHVLHVEAGRAAVKGKVTLDIGCGAGISSATFGSFGAHYIGIDHSVHAATYALRHLRGSGGDGFTVQGNAELLPIRDQSIDVVYSNGVLHHTPNFATAMDEAYRVLKPGGKAIIALYATYSTQFGVVRVLGALRGHLGRHSMERWMGRATEGDWRSGGRLNPWTETFSVAQLRRFLRRYRVRGLEFRKNGKPIGDIPRLGPKLMRSHMVRKLDRALEPLLGGMVIMSFNKQE